MGTVSDNPYLARNVDNASGSATGSKLTTSSEPTAGNVTPSGKSKSTASRNFHVFVGKAVSKSGTGMGRRFRNSMNSSTVLSFVPRSGGWYMISLITTGPTSGAAFDRPAPARNASTVAGLSAPKVRALSAVKSTPTLVL